MKYYIDAVKKYADFSGRTSRKEYWSFILLHFLFSFLVYFLLFTFFGLSSIPYYIVLLYNFFMLLPILSATVRRLHDTGRSGASYFFGFIPFVGPIILFVFLLQFGNNIFNEYGPPRLE
jgi:uncharacterized membrane protein YhaH (DUF805 family)